MEVLTLFYAALLSYGLTALLWIVLVSAFAFVALWIMSKVFD